MSSEMRQVLDQALQLPPDDRVEMARALLQSVDSPADETNPAAKEAASVFEERREMLEPTERDDERYEVWARMYL